MYKGIEIVRIAPLELILWHIRFRCGRAKSDVKNGMREKMNGQREKKEKKNLFSNNAKKYIIYKHTI